MTDITTNKASKRPFYLALIASTSLALVYWFGLPISFGYDPNKDRCLPDVHLSLLVHHAPTEIRDGDMLFFSRPQGILEYVHEEYVMKVVAGVPGDHILIKDGDVTINGKLVVKGFPLAASYYQHPAKFYEKDEVIPKGKLFMIGTNPLSDDSRYWGYLDTSYVRGNGYKIF